MPGGLWNYTAVNVADDTFTIPRIQPTDRNDTAIWTDDHQAAQFVSPVYDFLETNIPHTLMNYSDFPFPEGSSLFPRHEAVANYLHDYARDIQHMLTLETQVVSVQKVRTDVSSAPYWELCLLELKTNGRRKAQFDAVVVATGHYSDPFIPAIKGLAEFNTAHPGVVSHSKFYRNPDQYANKKVVVVGNSASGVDISAQVSTMSRKPVVVSEKSAQPTTVDERDWAKMKPQIVEFLPESRSIVFEDGSLETDIDAVIFCTGYFYSFPFLGKLEPPVITNGACARNLYEHVLYADDHTLAFIGIPHRVVPFPLSEAQSAWIARMWADRLPVPSITEMRAWESSEASEDKTSHNLAFPKDVAYINHLYQCSIACAKALGLDNDGVGKMPPYWDAEKAWVRENFPLIKAASRDLGNKRHEIKTLKDLGFTYAPKQ